MFDAIIIGAGICGASLARELAQYELKTLVLEKGSDVCAGTSKTNSATVHSGHDATPGTQKALYNVRGNAMFDKLAEELSVSFKRNGTIVFAVTQEDMASVRELKARADANGVPGAHVLDRAELLALEPNFGGDVIGGLYAPSGGIVCPYNLVIALCENAAQNNVEFRLNTRVTGIRREDRAWLVETGSGDFRARFVFNCAGVYADVLNNMVSGKRFTIIPRKGEHLILDKSVPRCFTATISQTPQKLPGGGHTKGMGMMLSVDGTIILGCNAVDITDKDDTATTAEGVEAAVAYFERNWALLPLRKCFPSFPRASVITTFAGLRAHPDTDDFIIGEAPDAPGFFNAAGIESPGLTAGPAIAKALADEAAQKYGFARNAAFNPLRRAKKPFRDMTPEEKRAAIKQNRDYGKVVCRCEQVTRAEILAAIRAPVGARTVNAIKMRTRAGMGRCQGGFCGPEALKILSAELGLDPAEITLAGQGSRILLGKTSECGEAGDGTY